MAGPTPVHTRELVVACGQARGDTTRRIGAPAFPVRQPTPPRAERCTTRPCRPFTTEWRAWRTVPRTLLLFTADHIVLRIKLELHANGYKSAAAGAAAPYVVL